MSNTSSPVLSCVNLAKTFSEGPLNVTVLRDVNLSSARGIRIGIVGAAGTG